MASALKDVTVAHLKVIEFSLDQGDGGGFHWVNNTEQETISLSWL